MSRNAIREMQNTKLREFLCEQLVPFSPHYKALFAKHKIDPRKIRTIDDLKHIPFSTKEDLLPTDANPQKTKDFILQPDEHAIKHAWPKSKLIKLLAKKITKGAPAVKKDLEWEYRPLFLSATTGRTYQPVSFLYTRYDLRNLQIAGGRLANVFGLTTEDRGVNVFPYAPHLAFWQVAFGSFESGVFLLSTGGGKVMGTTGNLNMIEKVKPQAIIGVPGFVYHLLRTAVAENRDLSFVKKVVVGAEKVQPGLKHKMADLLAKAGSPRVNIFGTFGFTEAKMAWGECPTDIDVSSGYHTYPDMEIFEIINPETGEVLPEGESGEIVYTAINSRGSTVIRYRTGDLARGGLILEPCAHCGRTVPRLSSDITRVSNIKEFALTKIKGTLVNLNNLCSVLADAPGIAEWQIEIRKKDNDPHEMDELVIYLAAAEGASPDKIQQAMTNKVMAETEVRPNAIIFLSLPEILVKLGMETEMKEKRIVDNRPH